MGRNLVDLAEIVTLPAGNFLNHPAQLARCILSIPQLRPYADDKDVGCNAILSRLLLHVDSSLLNFCYDWDHRWNLLKLDVTPQSPNKIPNKIVAQQKKMLPSGDSSILAKPLYIHITS